MPTRRKLSKIAGILYFIVIITGMFSLAYVPKELFIWESPVKTFENINTHETLFRLSIASSAVCYLAFIFLPLALYQLLKYINQVYATVMALLAIVSVPISFSNLQHKYAILNLVDLSKQNDAPALQDIQQLTMTYLTQYDNGILIATVFWGLWLLPFGYLVYKSNFLPKILGIFLMLGCMSYMINYLGNTLSSNYATLGISKYLSFLPAIGEIGICIWLLLIGVKGQTKKNG
ncbi:MAG: DUF4386 domain-containing protein [Agriterribacter sp.]